MVMPRVIEYLFNSFGPNRIVENSDITAPIGWYGDEESGRCIWVYPDLGRRGLEYFKFFDARMFYDATKVARIDFRSPRYVFCKNPIGISHWWLQRSEKEELMDFLISNNECDSSLTNWQAAIIFFNNEKEGYGFDETRDIFLPLNLKMPDYRKLPNK